MSRTPENAHETQSTEFENLGLDPALVSALQSLKLDRPTEAQRRIVPLVLEGKDVLARATTGAGKTNAYLLPIIQRTQRGQGLQALILQPTRALALQMERNLRRLARRRPLRIAVACDGGRDRARRNPLAGRPDVLIATPQAAVSLLRRRWDWTTVRLLVIDEADVIVDERGPEPIRRIHQAFDHEHQTLLLAGELDPGVRELAAEVLRDPVEVITEPGTPRGLAAEHSYCEVEPDERFEALVAFCRQQRPSLAIVFAADADAARQLNKRLIQARIDSRWIGERRSRRRHGGRREPGGGRGRSAVIVAHDPAPRQLTTIPASHVLHYDLPGDPDVYLQRLEQAARLRKNGRVISFLRPGQHELRQALEQRLGRPLQRLETPGRPSRPRPQREESKPSSEAAPAQPAAQNTGGRLSEPLCRDAELEARGIRPTPRTLGSRFRTTRRSRPLRRLGPF